MMQNIILNTYWMPLLLRPMLDLGTCPLLAQGQKSEQGVTIN